MGRVSAGAGRYDRGDDIVVTGQRQHYRGDIPIKDLPQAVQVISAETLRDVAATRLPEALDLAAGVARQNSFGGVWDAFAIRGFAGDINVPSGYLVNGFNARGFAGLRDTSAVERIEVLKGPGSALFGQGEPGGTIYIAPRSRCSTPRAALRAASAATPSIGARAISRRRLLNNSVAVRINGAIEQGRSFRDTLKAKRYFLTPSVLAKLGDSTSISYELEWSARRSRSTAASWLATACWASSPAPASWASRATGRRPPRLWAIQVELQHDFNSEWTLLVGASHRDTKLTGFGQTPELVASRQPFFTTGTILARQRRFSIYRLDRHHLPRRGERRFRGRGSPTTCCSAGTTTASSSTGIRPGSARRCSRRR